jgi:adenine-specific DNA-methyltransferase
MKYMGSKRTMLKNGLGSLLLEQSQKAPRVFDAFCGSASVAWFVAENTDKEVIAGDLQKYSVDLANSILLRGDKISEVDNEIIQKWINVSKRKFSKNAIDIPLKKTKTCVVQNRKISQESKLSLVKGYGGYYFSYNQALLFETLLKTIPCQEPLRSLALAALVEAASHCVASPGHTAQPFGLTENGLKAIVESWKRDPILYVNRFIDDFANRFANKVGKAKVTDAYNLANDLEEGDLIFLDPPYSGVHYSRFYHVLETISRGDRISVSGRGRYPAPKFRPKSQYSMRGQSIEAMTLLLKRISEKNANAILTFPTNHCSNGLSGELVKEISKKYFSVKKEIIKGRFSTLGGNNENRPARQLSSELVLLLEPK